MNGSLLVDEVYYSTLGADPDLGEIVTMFVDEMPERIGDLQSQFARADWDHLGRLAHQIKGAAGSYGFDQITPFATRLERAVRCGEAVVNIQAALDELTDACRRVRAGEGR